jgi:sulfite exporter TauE/SafE/copper chaperone CopZ/plastocyanin domain-containing protein
LKTRTIRIGGMTCVNCQNRIEKTLKSTVGVEDAAVSFSAGTATVSYDASVVTFDEIEETITKLDYTVLDDTARRGAPSAARGSSGAQVAGTLVIINALYMLMRQFSVSAMASAFPLAEAGMGYGMLFVIGLITSVHCVAMCGGINLSQCMAGTGGGKLTLMKPSVLYNAGRVVAYTIVGGIVGALGSALTISGRFQGVVQILAGLFMVIMGVNMLGLFPALRKFNPHPLKAFTKRFAKRIEAEKEANGNPFAIGLLNGLMPCGPLQAMQLYALSTGNPVSGAVSMFLFSVGTVPLMFALGAASTVLSGRFTARVMKVGAVLVAALGLTMLANGWSLGGLPDPVDKIAAAFDSSSASSASAPVSVPPVVGGVQIVNSTLDPGRYPAITVQAGIPVKWTINAPQGSINGCNNRMFIREYGIEHRFTAGENVIEFTPEKAGRVPYSCWMGMIRSRITVVEEGLASDAGGDETQRVPAGVVIPSETIAIAEYHDEEKYQTVAINLRDDGFFPSVIAVQRDIPAIWVINNDSREPGNRELVFPAYYVKVPMEDGENAIQLVPTVDFDFSTTDNVYYGFVKVVDNIRDLDAGAIKNQVAGFETQIYSEDYFADGPQSGCCR